MKPARLQRRPAAGPGAGRRRSACADDVRVVATPPPPSRPAPGAGTIIPACLRTSSSAATTAGSPVTNPARYPARLRRLRHRVHREQAGRGRRRRRRGAGSTCRGAAARTAPGSTRRTPRPRRAPAPTSTTLRRCSTGSTRPVGLDGELSQTSADTRGAERRQRRPCGTELGAGEQRAHLVGRVGDLRDDDQVARGRARAASAARRRAPWSRSSAGRRRGSTATPKRRASDAAIALAQLAACRAWSGSPGRPRPARPARRAPRRASGPPACRRRGRRSRPGCARGDRLVGRERVPGKVGQAQPLRPAIGRSGSVGRVHSRAGREVLDPLRVGRRPCRPWTRHRASPARRRSRRSPWCRPPTASGTSSS